MRRLMAEDVIADRERERRTRSSRQLVRFDPHCELH